jgi:hypothetical protein
MNNNYKYKYLKYKKKYIHLKKKIGGYRIKNEISCKKGFNKNLECLVNKKHIYCYKNNKLNNNYIYLSNKEKNSDNYIFDITPTDI